MKNTKRIQNTLLLCTLVAAVACAQESAPSTGGWRRVGEPAPAPPPPEVSASTGTAGPLDAYGQSTAGPSQQQQQRYDQRYEQMAPVPPELTVRPGTFLTIRVDQPISSDHNQPGDAFSGTLVKPLVVDGVVVAQRGQTIAGRVAEVQKAGRVSGTSRLAIEITDITLVDGQQLRLRSQLVSYSGPTSNGRDAQAVVTTTGVGAAVGAIADGGVGAGIGAGAGAAAGLIGVLLTRGHQTVIYPETVLTFRVEAPMTISTARAPQAFHFVDPREYEREPQPRLQTRVAAPPPAYYSPYPYYYSPYPYYWGPGLGFFYGSGFYGRGYYGGGFYSRPYYRGGFYGGGRGYRR